MWQSACSGLSEQALFKSTRYGCNFVKLGGSVPQPSYCRGWVSRGLPPADGIDQRLSSLRDKAPAVCAEAPFLSVIEQNESAVGNGWALSFLTILRRKITAR